MVPVFSRLRIPAAAVLVLLLSASAFADVVRIEIRRRDDAGTHVRFIGRVYFAVDPDAPTSRGIADIASAPRNAQGLVEFSSDLLFFAPKDAARSRHTVFFEIVNRGRDQSLGLMSDAIQLDLAPEHWNLGDRFVLKQGFALAFLGWQFDVKPADGLTFQAPVAPVEGLVRATYIVRAAAARATAFEATYCAADAGQPDATLTVRARIDGPAETLPRDTWRFGPGGCSVQLPPGAHPGLYEAVYHARGSPVAGLGMAAIRDFASYLKHGGPVTALGFEASPATRVIGFGYSQSARFLREFVRDGFNADTRGRTVFDGMMIASAGAGVGSFNHRFAMPGQAGNSVLSTLRPVDLPPFTDDGLLAAATTAGVVPRIFYTLSSTEYWARAASLTLTNEDATVDVAPAATSRVYFLGGTPHAGGPLTARPSPGYAHPINFAEQRWPLRALLVAMDEWIRSGKEPPPSRYPTLAGGELVPRTAVRFPPAPVLPFPSYMPQVWRMDYGQDFGRQRIITKERPDLGMPYALMVPQVNADGNDVGGLGLPEIAVPLGTFTGWNVAVPPLPEFGYLAGLIGSFEPFASTRRLRERAGDSRPSIAERYRGDSDYLKRVSQAAQDLVRQRLMLPGDVPAVMDRAKAMWTTIVEGPNDQ